MKQEERDKLAELRIAKLERPASVQIAAYLAMAIGVIALLWFLSSLIAPYPQHIQVQVHCDNLAINASYFQPHIFLQNATVAQIHNCTIEANITAYISPIQMRKGLP